MIGAPSWQENEAAGAGSNHGADAPRNPPMSETKIAKTYQTPRSCGFGNGILCNVVYRGVHQAGAIIPVGDPSRGPR